MTLQHAPPSASKQQHTAVLRLIGAVKVLKGLGLILAAISVFHLIHKDAGETITEWCHRFHIAPGNRFVVKLIQKISTTNTREFVVLGSVFLAYAAMFLTEGIGLLLAKHWAEWMAVITTAGLIPFEIYEMIHKPTWIKAGAMVLNIVVAIYLFVRVRREARERKEHLKSS